ncbi:hypothetical protein RB195_001111 [Necator americanus]|uniref:DUF547 domain-containing protein n=1 Tax=Necator americanus TaxID=51031 RepID=A0ABR1DCW6_NECAM
MLPTAVLPEDADLLCTVSSEGDNCLRYSPSWESDEECYSDFAFSDICLNAFHYSGYRWTVGVKPEIIDEDGEFLTSTNQETAVERYSNGTKGECGALNKGHTKGQQFSVSEYNEVLVNLMTAIFADILCDNNRTILYYKLQESQDYNAYIEHTRNLCNVNLTEASDDERLALFLNIYNMMWIHVTHIHGPPRSIWERRKLMNCSYYQIQHHKYAPHSILDGILRSNRKGLGTLWKPFGKVDGRLPFILSSCEPLVHFALNTGTRSTPPIRPYNCKTVREEMRNNACDILETDNILRIDTKKKVLYLAKVFKWYANDFGGTTEKTIEWILTIMEKSTSKKRIDLEEIYYGGHYELVYIQHDWAFNGETFENKL